MNYYAFANLFREGVELVPHGFMVIDNDPTLSYDEKFFFGVADQLPFDINNIIACEEAWKDNIKQLTEIATGEMQEKIDRKSKFSEPGANIFDKPKPNKNGIFTDMDDRQRPVWNARDYALGL